MLKQFSVTLDRLARLSYTQGKMKVVTNFVIFVILAVALVFVVSMVFNFFNAFVFIKTLYQEDNVVFWAVIAIYLLIVIVGLAFYVKKKISGQNGRR